MVHEQPRGALRHLATWAQAVGLVCGIAIGMVVLGAAPCSRDASLHVAS